MKDKIRIAIDGPGGAGKSTIAKRVATRLGIDYIDTGAMYRAAAYKMICCGIAIHEKDKLQAMLDHTEIDFSDGNIFLDGKIVNDVIRAPEVSKMASDSSALAMVREKLVGLQKQMGVQKSVIMDGRDIGTNVLPDAEVKIFMTAALEERARRRYQELVDKGQSVSLSQVLEDMETRDRNDTSRALNPLQKATDAIELDTTELTIEEAAEEIIKRVRRIENGNHSGI